MPLDASRCKRFAISASGVLALLLLSPPVFSAPPLEDRVDRQSSLTLDPAEDEAHRGKRPARSARIEPSLWTAYLGERLDDEQGGGLSVFSLLPVQLGEHFRVRAAYRYTWLDLHGPPGTATRLPLGVTASSPTSAAAASARQDTHWHQHDGYLGFGFGGSDAWLDLLGIALFPSDERAVAGQAARLRLGRDFGLDTFEATLDRDRGYNGQLSARLFVWAVDWFRLSAGPRFTFDDRGNPASLEAAATLLTRPIELNVEVHSGVQRWPVSADVPMVLTSDQDLPLGGSAVLLVPLSPAWALGLSTQLDKLSRAEKRGSYTSFSAGVRWAPFVRPRMAGNRAQASRVSAGSRRSSRNPAESSARPATPALP